MTTDTMHCPNGHQWSRAEHDDQCPFCGTVVLETIANGFAEHGSTDDRSTVGEKQTSDQTQPSKFGRYEVLGELGRGGMGVVYRAFDPLHRREVAVKTLPSSDPTKLTRFKREFRTLVDINHPNVVKFFELSSDAGTWFFTMEIVAGIELLDYVGYGIAKDPTSASQDDSDIVSQTVHATTTSEQRINTLRRCFGQLALALDTLHKHGIVHRDIKPSNVIVTDEGRVVLLDFGLVAETDTAGMHQSLHIMGTAAYMSPEQAACEPVSPASDWYSMGVMLFQALTGSLPHSGKMVDILVNKQTTDAPSPQDFSTTVTDDWNDLCVALLRRDAERRPSATDILNRFNAHVLDEQELYEPQLDVASLTGRDTQLRAIHDCWLAVRNGDSTSVFVEGESGTGKSALVEAFIGGVADARTVILRGRCYEMESVPFKAIDSLVDSLVLYLTQLPNDAAAALMPRDVHALAQLFPVIGQVEAVQNLPKRNIDTTDQQEFNRRAIGALRELLVRIGDRSRLIVYIDDLQWGDEDSATMLFELLQPPDAPVLLFLGTFRSEDVESSPFLTSFRRTQHQRAFSVQPTHLTTPPLQFDDATKLALSFLNIDDADAQRTAESIATESAGNPFFISELAKHHELDIRDSDRTSLFEMIWARVTRLPDDSRELLFVVALSGQPLPLEQAIRIANVDRTATSPLRSSHLIRTVGLASSPRIETYHDRVRESVSSSIDKSKKQQLHLRIATEFSDVTSSNPVEILNALQNCFADPTSTIGDHIEVPTTWYDVAYHYDAGGRFDLAFVFALATAEHARSQFSLEVAEQQYRIAARGLANRSTLLQYHVTESLGDTLMLRGNYPEAAEKLESAREFATERNIQAQIVGKLGELAFKRGDNAAGIRAMEESLTLLARKIPGNRLSFLFALASEVFVQTLHTLFPKRFLERHKAEGAESELLAIDMHVHLTRVYFFERGKVPSLWTNLRSMNLAERFHPTSQLGSAWAGHAPVMSVVPWFARGEAYARKSLSIRTELGDLCGQGQSLHYLAVIQFAAANYKECISSCEDGIALLERSGDYWERNTAWYTYANAIFRTGDVGRAIAESQKLYKACAEIGDDKVLGFSLDVWSRASLGQVPPDITRPEVNKVRNDVWATSLVSLAEAIRLIRIDELDDALTLLHQAYDTCRDGGMNAWVLPILPWMAKTYRLRWEKDDKPNSRNPQFLRRAKSYSRRGISAAKKFRTELPHVLREAAMLAAAEGRLPRAKRFLEQSQAVATRQGAIYEVALSRLQHAKIGADAGWGIADAELEQTHLAVAEFESAATEASRSTVSPREPQT